MLQFTTLILSALLLQEPAPVSRTDGPWRKALDAATEGVDRLTVTPTRSENPPVEIVGTEAIRTLISSISIYESESGFHCMCWGDFQIVMYRGKEKAADLSWHHGQSLRWNNGKWKGDALLDSASCLAIPKWFEARGFPAMEKARLAALERARREQEERDLFLSFFPEVVRKRITNPGADGPDFEKTEEAAGRLLVADMKDPVAAGTACFKALGAVDGSWTSTDSVERVVIAAAKEACKTSLLPALESIKEDPRGLKGAARILYRELGLKALPKENRTEWSIRLAKVTLTDGIDENKPTVLNDLTHLHDPAAQDLLREIAQGRVGREIQLDHRYGEEPGLRAGACLELARSGDVSVKPLLEAHLKTPRITSDRAAAEVSLALLGDATALKLEHFKLNSYSIGLAGLEAIEKFGGREDMELLIKGGLDHPYAYVRMEAVLTAERITGQKWYMGERSERPDWHLDKVRAWWAKEGVAFVAARRAAPGPEKRD